MRVISKKMLREFWVTEPAANGPLNGWYKVVTREVWYNFADLRQTYNTADVVGDCVVFNVGGNKYRVIGQVRYADAEKHLPGVVYIRRVMTHAEYDENKWPDQCGCHLPPPGEGKAKRGDKKKPAPGARPVRRPKKRGK